LIQNRIEILIKSLGLNTNSFANKIGVKNAVIHNIVSHSGRRSKPSFDLLSKIILSFDNINSNWIITGDGNIFNSEKLYAEDDSISVINEPKPTYYSKPDLKGIPIIATQAMTEWEEDQIMEYGTKRYVVPEFEESKADFVIAVREDSMTPNYIRGDIVACKRLSNHSFFQWNKVYVLNTEQGGMIKRIKKSTHDHSIVCASDNKDFEPFDISKTKIKALAIVVGLIRFE